MLIRILTSAAVFTLMPQLAVADPTGTYDVVGKNADGNGEYHGTVVVRRTGETYSVVWDIAGTKFIGTGLGAKFVSDNRFEMGVASPDDSSLSVGYVAQDSFGMAMYFEQPDGHWEGIWTYGGSTKATSENWYPR